MLSTIFYRISAVATNLRKNVEETFTPKTPVITSTEPVFITNTITVSPTPETTTVVCETVEPTVSPKLMREYSIMNIEEDACSGDCTNCIKTVDVEECRINRQNSVLHVATLSNKMTRACSKACVCIDTGISAHVEPSQCDLSGNCYDGNNECCSDD
jgi:hypothetical protein